MNITRLASSVVLALAVVGCGDDDTKSDPGPTSQPGTMNPTAAKSTASSAASAASDAANGGGATAAFSLANAGYGAFTLITPSGGAAPQAVSGRLREAKQRVQTGTCDCDDTSCTFEGCGDDSGAGAFVLDGTMSWSDDHLLCDLTITADIAGLSYSFHEVCDLVVTDTSIDGTLTTAGSFAYSQGGQSGESEWDTSIEFQDVALDNGCATSGTVDFDVSITSGGQSYSGEGSVTFDGTGC